MTDQEILDGLRSELSELQKLEATLTDDELDERDYDGVRGTSDVIRSIRKFKAEHSKRCSTKRVGVAPCTCFTMRSM